MQYMQDYDETVMPHWVGVAVGPSAPYPGTARWMDLCQPYAKSTGIFVCPDSTAKYIPNDVNNMGSYSCSAACYSDPSIYTSMSILDNSKFVTLFMMQAPATTFWIADTTGPSQNADLSVARTNSAGLSDAAVNPAGFLTHFTLNADPE